MKKTQILLTAILCFCMCKTFAQNKNGEVLGVWGHGNKVSKSIIKSMPYIHGWNFTFQWRDLEPEKGKFDWKLFDDQIKVPINSNINVGFMVWVGQFSPEWVYDKDGVQKVLFNDKMHKAQYYPYYMNPAYKADYFAMMQAVADHIKQMPLAMRSKISFWMSAEGSTGDETPYKATPLDPQFNISDKDWTEYKREAWSFMYNFGNSLEPKLNILINPANSGKYFDYVTKNFPHAWLKAGSLAHTYKFDGELAYYDRLKKVVNPDNNGLDNRIRGESETVQEAGWFKASPQQNNFSIITSALHIGLDIINVRADIEKITGNNTYPFQFFNKYAGQRDPATATGAFCVFRDVLDVNDTKRFPEDKYGQVSLDGAKKGGRKKDLENENANAGSGNSIIKMEDVNPARLQSILKEFAPYGAKNGTTPQEDKVVYSDDEKLQPKMRKENLRRDLQDKYFDDFGADLVPGNYNKFLDQYSPNTTSRGRWRIGPVDQPFGRFARSFDHSAGMNEMFFALDKNFYADKGKQQMTLSVTYFDKGNGTWTLNFYDGNKKTQAYEAQCKNTGRWVTKSVNIPVVVNQKLDHDTDFTLKYTGGDDTIFGMFEVTRN
ncbi:MAG: hypothetical protein ABIT58_01445 [Ferruginibacter sp.]